MAQPFRGSELDRRIQLQRPVVTRDPTFGAEQTSYVAVATVWAKRIEAAGNTGTSAEQRVAARQVQHLIRFRDDVQAGWRVVDGPRRFRITGMPVETGRRSGLLIDSEESSDA